MTRILNPTRAAAALASLLLIASCGGASGPDGSLEASFDSLRSGKVSSFMEAVAPPGKWDEMAAEWEEKRAQPVSPMDAKQFSEMMTLMTEDGAEKKIFDMVKPQLETAQGQLAAAAGMLQMMVSGGMGGDVPAGASQVIGQLGSKLGEIDITDEAKVKEAIKIVVSTAKGLKLPDMDTVNKLDFDAMMGKTDQTFAGAKSILDVYGLSLDDTIDSMKYEVISSEEDSAEIKVSYSLFGGAEQSTTAKMKRVDGRWIPE